MNIYELPKITLILNIVGMCLFIMSDYLSHEGVGLFFLILGWIAFAFSGLFYYINYKKRKKK